MRLAVVLFALCGAPALAQERPVEDGWSLNVGAGGLVNPTYEGDDAYRLSILPNIQVTYGDSFFASVQEGIGYRVIKSDTVRAGPIVRIRFSRDEDGDQPFALTGDDSTDLIGLGDVDTSVELGGFLEYEFGSITFSVEARKAVTGHEGLVADVGARWSGRSMAFGPPVIWSIGPRARVADDNFTSAYFGVTRAQSLASGLPVYAAEGGLHSYGIGATAIVPIDRDGRWTAVAFAGYDQLAGDPADSPLVQLRGAESQATLGIFVSYRVF
jgi:outer membrane protein